MTEKPTHIDRNKLSYESAEAVRCWRQVSYRVRSEGGFGPVEEVWATRQATYWSDPNQSRHTSGSQDTSPVYATEHDAWLACIAEFKKWSAGRIEMLEAKAEAAKGVKYD